MNDFGPCVVGYWFGVSTGICFFGWRFWFFVRTVRERTEYTESVWPNRGLRISGTTLITPHGILYTEVHAVSSSTPYAVSPCTRVRVRSISTYSVQDFCQTANQRRSAVWDPPILDPVQMTDTAYSAVSWLSLGSSKSLGGRDRSAGTRISCQVFIWIATEDVQMYRCTGLQSLEYRQVDVIQDSGGLWSCFTTLFLISFFPISARGHRY